MFFIFDLIALLIFLINVISCRVKGFFKSFFGMLKVIIAIIVAYVFMPTVAYFYRTSFVDKMITNAVAERINSFVQSTAEGMNLEKLFADMPTEFADIINRYGANAESLEDRFGNMVEATGESVNELASSITSSVSHMVSDILAFATLFVGSLIILSIVIWIVGMIMKLPVLSSLDKGLGFIFGVISGLLIVWVYCNIVILGVDAISIVKPGIIGDNVIENTYIIRYVSENLAFGFAAP